MKRIAFFSMSLTLLLLFAPLRIGAQTDIQTQPVVFAAGQNTTSLEGSLKGRQTIDYALTVKAGQQARIELETKHAANYFNLLPPGSSDVAIYIGQIEGNHFEGTMEQDGVYKVRVYLMPSAARRNETAHYTLHISVTGN